MTEFDFIKSNLKGLKDFIRWREVLYVSIALPVGYFFFGWWGILLALALDWVNHLEGGIVSDLFDEYYEPEHPPNICSAGIEGCGICNNEYNHDFNVKYNKNKKWYE